MVTDSLIKLEEFLLVIADSLFLLKMLHQVKLLLLKVIIGTSDPNRLSCWKRRELFDRLALTGVNHGGASSIISFALRSTRSLEARFARTLRLATRACAATSVRDDILTCRLVSETNSLLAATLSSVCY